VVPLLPSIDYWPRLTPQKLKPTDDADDAGEDWSLRLGRPGDAEGMVVEWTRIPQIPQVPQNLHAARVDGSPNAGHR